ncbi:MAG: thiamine pyrophosphate-dependent enzyme, partial [Pseudomonadota bacterium]|nr:thiamine pyrophosphate-dependent enzyme [Pseudomonadota bacterium]
YRPQGAGARWPLGDPLERLRRHLVALGEWDEERHAALQEQLAGEVRAAQREAEKLGTLGNGHYEDITSLFEDVFETVPWHLAEQRDEAVAEAEARRK